MIVKIYQGTVEPRQIQDDAKSAPQNTVERIRKALPFPGILPDGGFQRNDFTYGVAFFQHGYLDQAAASFEQVIASKPESAEAHYNLGTLDLRRNNLPDAQRNPRIGGGRAHHHSSEPMMPIERLCAGIHQHQRRVGVAVDRTAMRMGVDKRPGPTANASPRRLPSSVRNSRHGDRT